MISEVDSFDVTVQAIDDSDPPVAANFNTSTQSLSDRTRWLKNRTGLGRLHAIDLFTLVDTNALTSPQTIATWSAATYTPEHSLEKLHDEFTNTDYVTLAGDIVDVTLTGTATLTASGASLTFGQIKLRISFDNGSTWFDIAAADARIGAEAPTAALYFPITLQGFYLVTTSALNVKIGVVGRVYDATSGQALTLSGSLSMVTRVWRANP